MTSKENDRINDEEDVNDMYQKMLDEARARTHFLDNSHKPRYLVLTLPIRVAEFAVTAILFSMVIYLMALSESGLRNTTTIFMISLTGSYLFFATVQIIAHFAGDNPPEYPFVFFNFLGMCLYTTAGCAIIYTAPTRSWGRLATFLLSFMIAALHAASVLIILVFWRERIKDLQKYYIKTNKFLLSSQQLHPRNINSTDVCRCEAATSISNCEVLSYPPAEDVIEVHSGRKIAIGHRRVYIDKQCDCPEAFHAKTIEVQTEYGENFAEGTQTSVEVKEITIQTLDKCDLCNRDMMEPEPTPIPIEEPPKVASPRPSIQPEPTPQPRTPLPSFLPPIQLSQATQSGCIIPCPNAPSNTPFIILPRGLGFNDGFNPCCGACNCGNPPTTHAHAHPHPQPSSQPHQEPENSPISSQVSRTPTIETIVVEPVTYEATVQHNRGSQTVKRINVDSMPKEVAESASSSSSSSIFLIHKNKRTQTKNKFNCASEETNDDIDDKEDCRCKRVLFMKSEIKNMRKMQKIDEDDEDKHVEKVEQNIKVHEPYGKPVMFRKNGQRTKPLYRESLENRGRMLSQTPEFNTENSKRFRSKISPSPSQTRTPQSRRNEELISRIAWPEVKNYDYPEAFIKDFTVHSKTKMTDPNPNRPFSRQSSAEYLPMSASRTTREYAYDNLIDERDKNGEDKKNEFPEEF